MNMDEKQRLKSAITAGIQAEAKYREACDALNELRLALERDRRISPTEVEEIEESIEVWDKEALRLRAIIDAGQKARKVLRNAMKVPDAGRNASPAGVDATAPRPDNHKAPKQAPGRAAPAISATVSQPYSMDEDFYNDRRDNYIEMLQINMDTAAYRSAELVAQTSQEILALGLDKKKLHIR